MTLQQLKYAVTVAECGTISAAAEKLFISQPSLTTAIRELESEMGVTIFSRTNRGVIVSREGEEFLGYARQILSQAQLLQERFSGREQGEKRFAVSSQHFNFTVLAFSRLVQNFRGPRYSFHFRETTTYEVLEDVSQLRSEVGILALNEDNERFLRRMFGKLGLEFTELKRVQAELFVSAEHPLAGRRFVTVEDVSPYPCITFEQGEHNGQFFFEGLSAVAAQSHKTICVRERATEYQLLPGCGSIRHVPGGVCEPAFGAKAVPHHWIYPAPGCDSLPHDLGVHTGPAGGSADIVYSYTQLSFSVFYKYQIYPYTEYNKAKQNKMLKGDLKS